MKPIFQFALGIGRVQKACTCKLQSFLEAVSLFLVFSVQTKPNKTLHLNGSRSEHTKNFNAEIRLPYSNWFEQLSFFAV